MVSIYRKVEKIKMNQRNLLAKILLRSWRLMKRKSWKGKERLPILKVVGTSGTERKQTFFFGFISKAS